MKAYNPIEWLQNEAPLSISGQRGHDRLFHVCAKLAESGLKENEIIAAIQNYYNPRLPDDDQWSASEIRHKAKDVIAKTAPTENLTRSKSAEGRNGKTTNDRPNVSDEAYETGVRQALGLLKSEGNRNRISAKYGFRSDTIALFNEIGILGLHPDSQSQVRTIWPNTWQDEQPAGSKEKRYSAKGRTFEGFWGTSEADVENLILTEGWKDAAAGFEALGARGFDVAALPSAGVIKPEWLEEHRGKKVLIFLDNDPAGRKATEKVIEMVRRCGLRPYLVDWEELFTILPENVRGKLHEKDSVDLYDLHASIGPVWIANNLDNFTFEPRYSNTDEVVFSDFEVNDFGNVFAMKHCMPSDFAFNEKYGWLWFNGYHWERTDARTKLLDSCAWLLKRRRDDAISRNAEAEAKFCVPNCHRIKATACVAETQYFVPASEFNTEKGDRLLPCRNGVIDLKSGRLLPHSSEHRFTFSVPIEYDPEAPFAEWEHWLIDNTSHETCHWLQLAIGYSITGLTEQEILFYLWGPPRSGKGVFTETLMKTLGDPLSRETGFETFSDSKTDTNKFHLAPLQSSRVIFASESGRYERLNEAEIKRLTGRNKVHCCFKGQTHFNYDPKYKIWLSSNHPPKLDPDDDAAWHRIRMVSFPKSHMEKEDTTLKKRFAEQMFLQGVLNWAIEGAREYLERMEAGGFRIEELSRTQKAKVRLDQDLILQFLDECTTERVGAKIQPKELFSVYVEFCEGHGVSPKSLIQFSQSLKAKGIESVKAGGTRYYPNIALSVR